MKDFKHQLLEQLDDVDIIEEFKRRKLHDARITENMQEPCKSQLVGPLAFFLFNLLLILIIYYLTK